jgi:SAM-dependent methyltransferase
MKITTNPFLTVDERAAWGPASLEMALPLVEAVGIQPGMRILEVGGGSGQIATILAAHWNVTVFTLEPWDGGEQIQARAAAAGVWDKVIALKLNAQDLPFATATFDAVISIGSFEMIGDERPQALTQMVRVLKPGGRLGIAEPMCLPVPMPSALVALDTDHHLGFQEAFRTIAWNCALFEQHGLSITHQHYFTEANQWWLDYAAESNISDAEKELIRANHGQWLSLGMVVGQKVQ